ncbi:XRE family transcriptional regulator [Rhodococcus opacus]|uniref:XRE family transcriptional regulator n=1 Tax=Rhodococcus opacus TaxID=37919 RepID=UPI001FF495AC|nr:XRE family transcriptional regulator [Rhodococcus opacus]UOT06776.1 XRE family transcriptional regulator [Rhodococcus opacus]
MTGDGTDKLQAARRRRSERVVTDFDGKRLSLARRLTRKQRTVLARDAGVTPAAITQFEKGQARPTAPVLGQMAIAMGFPVDFFRQGRPIEELPTSSAHFRSLRSTPALTRDQALAFAEMSLAVVDILEQYVEFPAITIPDLGNYTDASDMQISKAARATRSHLGIPSGPVSHVVRNLEASGVVVLRLPPHIDRSVDAFSVHTASRPLVLLSPAKDDKARSRFDASHELGHLVMHREFESGSKMVESQAHTFASYFLMPEGEIEADLPRRVNWELLHEAKKKWGVSLRALVYRAHRIGLWSEASYRRANQELSRQGLPEPGPLGPPESPGLLGHAGQLIEDSGTSLEYIARIGGFTFDQIAMVISAGRENKRKLQIVLDS